MYLVYIAYHFFENLTHRIKVNALKVGYWRWTQHWRNESSRDVISKEETEEQTEYVQTTSQCETKKVDDDKKYDFFSRKVKRNKLSKKKRNENRKTKTIKKKKSRKWNQETKTRQIRRWWNLRRQKIWKENITNRIQLNV